MLSHTLLKEHTLCGSTLPTGLTSGAPSEDKLENKADSSAMSPW